MIVKSKYRPEYWVVLFFSSVFWVFIIAFFFYHSSKNGKIEFNIPFWSAILLLIGTISYLRTNLYYDIKQVTVSEKGILLKYYFGNKTEFIEYENIVSFKTSRHSGHEFAGKRDGYEKLEVLLKEDEFISFNGNQYKNYNELKKSIYLNYNKQ